MQNIIHLDEKYFSNMILKIIHSLII